MADGEGDIHARDDDLIEEVERLRRRVAQLEEDGLALRAACMRHQQAEELFHSALARTPSVAYTMDAELRYTWLYNPLHDLRVEDTIGKTDAELIDPVSAERIGALKRRVLASGAGERQVVSFERKGRTIYHDLSVEPLYDRAGQIAGVCGISTDVTERVRAEMAEREREARNQDELEEAVAARTASLIEANQRLAREIEVRLEIEELLRRQEARWRSLIENAPETIAVIDRQGTILLLNRSLSEYPEDRVIGSTIFDHTPPENRPQLEARLREVFELGQTVAYETSAQCPYKGPQWHAARLAPVFRGGVVEAAIVITSDVSDRMRAEAELAAEERLLTDILREQELDRRIVAYEIHDRIVQHVSAAILRLEALACSDGLSSRQLHGNVRPALGVLRDALGEARRMISGLRPPILDEAGLTAAIEHMRNDYARTSNVAVHFSANVGERRFSAAVESTMFRICQEALDNAVRHSGAARVDVELTLADGWLHLVVRDGGRGFDPATIAHHDLGLQSMLHRARLAGGQATIMSDCGQGTTVDVELPAEPPRLDVEAVRHYSTVSTP